MLPITLTSVSEDNETEEEASPGSPWHVSFGGDGWFDWSDSNTYLSVNGSAPMGAQASISRDFFKVDDP